MTPKDKNGFTLIEILIATLVFAIVITLLFSSFQAFMISTKRVKADLQDSEKMTLVDKRIRLDLQSIFILQPPQYKVPQFNSDPDPYRLIGEQVNIDQTLVSTLMFSSLAHTDVNGLSRPGAARIAYYLKENEDKSFDLYRSDVFLPYPDGIGSCLDPVLCTQITGFDIVYFDENGDDFLTWDSESNETGFSYPTSIEFKLTTGRDEDRKTFVIAVNLQAGRPRIE